MAVCRDDDHESFPANVSLTVNRRQSKQARHPSDVIGNCGPVQATILIVLMISYFVAPFNNATIVFYDPKYDFHCLHFNRTSGSVVKLRNTCHVVDDGGVKQVCSNFTYDDRIFKRTLVSEFDLVCSRSHYGSVAQSVHQFGYLVSGLVLGRLSDRIGRRFTLITSMMLEVAGGIGCATAPSIYVFLVFRFLVGLASYGRFLTSYILLAEWMGPKARASTAALFEYGYLLSAAGLPLAFYLMPDFRVLQTLVSLYETACLIPVLLLVWESPKWLLTHGRGREAAVAVRRAAHARNRLTSVQIEKRIQEVRMAAAREIDSAAAEQQTALDVLKEKETRTVALILYLTWFTMAFNFHVFSINIQNLGGNLFVTFSLFTAMDTIMHTVLLFIIDRFQRRTLLRASLLVQAAALVVLIHASLWTSAGIVQRMLAACVSRGAMWFAYDVIYLLTTETMATSMRQSGMGTCSVFARFGSILAPFLKQLTLATHLSVTLSIVLLLVLMNVLLTACLPETGRIQVPDTVQQVRRGLREEEA